MKVPVILLLHGLPATGKTTLGKELAQKLNVPFISRDTYKEILFDSLGENDRGVEWSKKLGAASFDIIYTVIEQMLAGNTLCVFETFWTRKFAELKLTALAMKYHAKIVQVFFYTDPAVRKKRFEKRAQTTRHAAHMDTARLQIPDTVNERENNEFDNRPLDLPGTVIQVDTTDISKIRLDELVSTLRVEVGV